MNRREFIKVVAAGSGVVFVPSIFNGCSVRPMKALGGWRGHPPGEKDIRIIVLSYAILAPNPHNKQPWIIDLTGPERFDLYVDRSRLLPETDPPFRQIHIGQGTFLENLDLAARNFGYRADITYFPRGMYGNAVVERKPVASIELVREPGISKPPLFDQILKRQSNKKKYNDRPLSQKQVEKMMEAYDTREYPLSITTDSAKRKKLAEFMVRAMEIEADDEKRNGETLAMFRFNDDEVEKHRDGFGVAQSGTTGFQKFLVETFFLARETFEKQAIELTSKQAYSAAAFGWITSKTNTRLDQLKVGRAYVRTNLMAASLGLAQHPMSQVLQEYPDMASLQQKFKQFLGIPESHTVQMLFRLGHAEPVIHAPRRRVKDLLKA